MFMCPKCGKMLEDGMRFCDNCGAQILDAAVCPNCGEPILPGYAFCQKCGAPVGQTAAPNPGAGYTPVSDPGAGYVPNPGGYTPNPGAGYTPVSDPSAGYAPNPGYTADPGVGYAADPGYVPASDPGQAAPQQKKPIPKKALMFGGIGVAAVVVIVALVAIISSIAGGGGKSSGKTYMFYLRDSEIVYMDLKSGDKTEVTTRLANNNMSNYQLASSASGFGAYIAFSEDGTKLFYPDRTDFSNAEGVTLYYRNMKKTDEEPLKIDSDITTYAINKAGTVLIYNKGSDGNLYKHDLSNKEKIAGDVSGFYVADDLNKILYWTKDGNIYLWTADGEKTKVASDITTLNQVSEDLSTIYYTKDDALYKQTVGAEERDKIASEVSRIVSIYDTGEMYYIKSEDAEISLMDYVNDDMASSDAAMTQPEYPIEPTAPTNRIWYERYDGSWYYREYGRYTYYYGYTEEEKDEWQAQYDADYAVYEVALNKYNDDVNEYYDVLWPAWRAKLNRDSLRESLQDSTMDRTEYSLYYYNGSESVLVSDALTSAWNVSYSSGSPVMLMTTYEQSEVRKVKLSEVESYWEVYNQVYDALYSSTERYFAVQGSLSLFDEPEADYFRFSADGSTVYFLNDLSEDGDEGDLYKITVSDGLIGRAELFDSDVSTASLYFMSDGKFAYYKDVDNSKGDFYIDGTQIDYDVRLSRASYLNNAILYYTDWNSDKEYGTLKMYDNGEKTKIADDVHSFTITDDNNILYLYDYSTSSYKGTLYSYNKGKPEKIDDDVMALIPVSSSRTRGSSYYFDYFW